MLHIDISLLFITQVNVLDFSEDYKEWRCINLILTNMCHLCMLLKFHEISLEYKTEKLLNLVSANPFSPCLQGVWESTGNSHFLKHFNHA